MAIGAINGVTFQVVLGGSSATVNSVGLGAGCSLTVNSSLEANGIATDPGSVFHVTTDTQPAEVKIDQSATFSGSVIDTGRIIANTTNPFTGTQVTFAGGAIIGPGDLNGNLDAGPNSSFTFTNTGEFTTGATLGPGSGSVFVAAAVQIDGTLQDNTMTLELDPGGILAGPTASTGTLDENATFRWLGGILGLGGGTTIEASGQLLASGANAKTLAGNLTNMSPFTRLDGGGSLSLGGPGLAPGTIDNVAGTLELSLPTITGVAGSSLSNSALGTIQATAPASGPTTLSAPFTNDGNLKVDSGAALVLSNTGMGAAADVLDGVFQLMGNLTLLGAFTSVNGFMLDATPGFLELGTSTGSATATLTVPSGVTDTLDGNLEVNIGSTLTGAGDVVNAGRLQLDLGSSTAGLGSYQQTSIGTLALGVAGGFGLPATLAVTGTAQLSGTLLLMGYTPTVGAHFTVVTAGAVSGHFDTIPDGMDETDTATSVTVTQVRMPA